MDLIEVNSQPKCIGAILISYVDIGRRIAQNELKHLNVALCYCDEQGYVLCRGELVADFEIQVNFFNPSQVNEERKVVRADCVDYLPLQLRWDGFSFLFFLIFWL